MYCGKIFYWLSTVAAFPQYSHRLVYIVWFSYEIKIIRRLTKHLPSSMVAFLLDKPWRLLKSLSIEMSRPESPNMSQIPPCTSVQDKWLQFNDRRSEMNLLQSCHFRFPSVYFEVDFHHDCVSFREQFSRWFHPAAERRSLFWQHEGRIKR